jgi:hypothetical protein
MTDSGPETEPGSESGFRTALDSDTDRDIDADTDLDPDTDTESGFAFAPVSGAIRTAGRTRRAVSVLFRRRDTAAVLGGVSLVYLALYLIAVGQLVSGSGEFGAFVVEDLSLAFRSTGPFSFEPIARFDFGPLSLLFSPLDTLIGFGIAVLVGSNLALFYLAWRQPAACGLDSATGAFAAIPALLSGTACCGPVLLLVLGVQASGLLLAVFEVLLPLAVCLLLGSLVLVGRNVDPTLA